jgi:hypothetical protein
MADSQVPDQRSVTAEVLASVRSFLGGPSQAGKGWTFDFEEHLESNWGAVYGGALAAGSLAVARAIAPDQSPRSLHIQILRSVPRGRVPARASVRHAGRTVGTVEVELFDQRDRLAAVSLVTMVTPQAVASDHHLTTAVRIEAHETPLTPGSEDDPKWVAPISHALRLGAWEGDELVALEAENVRPSVDGTAAGVITCVLPWTALEHTGPEASCLLADALVAHPVMRSYLPLDAIGPNPDLTLRFTTAPAVAVIMGAAMLLSVQHGTTTVGIEIQGNGHQLAHGLATGLLLAPR